MSTLNDRDRENLTAYLDGELDPKAAQDLEAKINLDPEARKEVEALRQTWSLLDYLPKVTPSTGFTHRTMERLSLEKMGHALSYDSRSRRRMRFWLKTAGWSCGLLLMLGAGFGLGQVLFPKVQQVVEADEIQPVVVPVVRKAQLPSDQDWLNEQPKFQRDQYTALKDDAKKEFVAKLKQDERQRRQEWVIAGRFWKELEKGVPLPAKLTDFPPDVKTYVTEYLRPLLSKEEETRLDKAQGQWPLFPMTLVELTDKHPPALRGPKGPKTFDEMPAEVRKKFVTAKGIYPPKLVKAQGSWPGFALAVVGFAKDKKGYLLPHEFWAWDHSCLSPPMQDFVERKLIKVLNVDEKLRLVNAGGKWPEYPTTIQELADKYKMRVPWNTVPGQRDMWDKYRLPLAD
jgi:hypothetical protein